MAIQKVIQGNCLSIMKTMPEKSIDVSVFSPPYNIKKNYKSYEDNLPREDYLNWMGNVFAEIKRITKDTGSCFLNIGFTNKDPWLAMDVANIIRKTWVLQNNIIWIKSMFINDKTYGHFKPIQSNRFINNTFEHIFHFTKTGEVKIDRLAIGVPYTDKFNAERWGNEDLRCRGNCWFLPYQTIIREAETGKPNTNIDDTNWLTVTEAAEKAQVNKAIITMAANSGVLNSNGKLQRERRIDPIDFARWLKERFEPKNADHPAIFPESLPETCIKLHGVQKKMMVLDPFLGWGSTLIACKKLDINGIGIEIDEEYVKEAEKQISKNH